MASFSFGAGNVAKLLRIPLYGLGRIATLIIPRGKQWVFGCGAGIGDGALAVWNLAAADEVDAVWLVDNDRDEADAHRLGIATARKHSIRGFWLTARGGVLVVTHGLGDVNRYANGGAFIAQLWHGIPLKRIGLDSPETVRLPFGNGSRVLRALMKWLYRSTTSKISVIPAASQLIRGRLESAFALADDRVIVTGEPRVDPLSVGDAETRTARARGILTEAVGELPATVLLYAPTWRDGAADPAVPTTPDWQAIIAMLTANDAVLLVRSHPLGAGQYVPPSDLPDGDRVRLVGSDVVRDITPALPAVTALITDYSSLLFDVGLTPTPVVYLAPDVQQYAKTRGFYGSYRDVAGDDYATGWPEATAQLSALLSDDAVFAERRDRAAQLSSRVHDFRDGNNAQRVYREIQRRLSLSPRKGTS